TATAVPPTNPPLIELVPSDAPLEKRPSFSEEVTQNNCNGDNPLTQSISRSQTVSSVMELGGGLTVSQEGTVGGQLPGELAKVEVSVGTAVNVTFGITYGQEETLSRDLPLETPPGTKRVFTIQYYDLWQPGTLRITFAGETYDYPYSLRRGFAIEQTNTRDESCVTTPDGYALYDDFSTTDTLNTHWRLNDEQGLCEMGVIDGRLQFTCTNSADQDQGAALHLIQLNSSIKGIAMTVQVDQMGGPFQLTTRWQCPDSGEERGYHLELATDFVRALEFFPLEDWRTEALSTETAVATSQPHLLTIERPPDSITFLVDGVPLTLSQTPNLPACYTLVDTGISYWVWQGGNQISGFINDVFVRSE
ncbi:MAG: hypothetical protein KC415_10420, partial [Anaerolineales bacterium]|nr:hypothetical protein [Anaerolineales bacterium]